MNTTKFQEPSMQQFIHTLVDAPRFAKNGYTLHMDVPLQSLSYGGRFYPGAENLQTLSPEKAVRTLEFVICRDEEVLLAVLTEGSMDMEPLFDSCLQALPHLVRKPFYGRNSKEFENWEDLTAAVSEALKNPDLHSSYRLCSRELSCPANVLTQHRILDSCCAVSPFGRSCGLFFTFRYAGAGNAELRVCAPEHLLQKARRMSGNVPADACFCAARVQDLLSMPLTEFLCCDGEETDLLRSRFEHSQAVSYGSPDVISADMDTLGNALDSIREIWESDLPLDLSPVSPDDTWGSTIRYFACLLCSGQKVLRDMKLKDYMLGCARLQNSLYPLWAMETFYAPYLRTDEMQSIYSCTLGEMLSHLAAVPETVSDSEWNRRARLLTELLIMPVQNIL